MYRTIFTSKYFENKVKSFNIDNIKNIEYKKSVLNRWITAIKTGTLQNANETQIDITFLNDIFGEVLEYEYKVENSIKNLLPKANIESKLPDAVLGFFVQHEKNDIRAVIELKDIKKDLDILQNRIERITPVTQAFEYGRKAGTSCKWIIVSNIHTIRLYNKESDRYELFNLIDLENEFHLKRFFYLLHKDRLFFQNGESFVDILYRERIEEEIKISKEFYSKYQSLRTKLFEHIKDNNPQIEPLVILEKTQKILDRIIFICFCADLSIIPSAILKDVIKVSQASFLYYDLLWTLLKNLFTTLDVGNNNITKLNGGLFEDDDLLNNLIIKDDILFQALSLSEYDYRSDLNVNILGHIFEQSIADLEKIKTSIKKGEPPFFQEEKNGKRKAFGIFYTPEYITKHLVKETIGKWLQDRRLELGELELPDLTDKDYDLIKITKQGTLKTNSKIELHKNFWNQYLEKLLSIKILDPACGSGAFLVQCLDFLISEYRIIKKELQLLNPPEPPDEFKPKLKQGITLDFKVNEFDIEEHILKNCLFGVDLNFESVEITKLALWLKTVSRGKVLCDIEYNIQQGNSLIDDTKIVENFAFDWDKRFKNVMQHVGFDVIIGNPPYVDIKQIPNHIVNYFFENYKTCENRINLYSIFIEKGICLLNSKGFLSYINPNSFLVNSSYLKLRKLMFDGLFRVIKMPDDVFEDANVETAIFLYQKDVKHQFAETFYYQRNDKITGIEIDDYKLIEKSNWNGKFLSFNIYTTNEILGILKKCYEGTELLGDCSDISLGITPYDKYKGHSEETIENKVFHSPVKIDDTYKPLISGENIVPFIVSENIKEYIQYGDWLGAKRDERFFTEPRIIVRQILSGKPPKIYAGYTNKPLYFTQIGFSIIPKPELLDCKYVLALLNSSLLNFIHKYRFLDIQKDTFQKILIENCKLLPIKLISIDEQKPFVEQVNILIASNKKLSEITNNFTDLLISDLKLPKLSNKLENWYNLSWTELNDELNKQKKNIQLKELTKWKAFYSEQQPIALNISILICKITSIIDDMVFQLYSISDNYINSINDEMKNK